MLQLQRRIRSHAHRLVERQEATRVPQARPALARLLREFRAAEIAHDGQLGHSGVATRRSVARCVDWRVLLCVQGNQIEWQGRLLYQSLSLRGARDFGHQGMDAGGSRPRHRVLHQARHGSST